MIRINEKGGIAVPRVFPKGTPSVRVVSSTQEFNLPWSTSKGHKSISFSPERELSFLMMFVLSVTIFPSKSKEGTIPFGLIARYSGERFSASGY